MPLELIIKAFPTKSLFFSDIWAKIVFLSLQVFSEAAPGSQIVDISLIVGLTYDAQISVMSTRSNQHAVRVRTCFCLHQQDTC
jgi:hypothetical protein